MKQYGWIVDIVIVVCVTFLMAQEKLPVIVGVGVLASMGSARAVANRLGGGGNGSAALAILLGLGYYFLHGRNHSA